MDVSAAGIDLIKQFEGFRANAYQDSVGVWTIGWGHTSGARPGQTISRETATSLLRGDLQWAVSAVNRLVKVRLAQPQFDALVSFVFNLGEGNFAKSTLLRRLNAGDFAGAADQFAVWNKAGGRVLPGLTRRRSAEAALFQRAAPTPVVTVSAPRAATVSADIVPAPWWQRVLGLGKPKSVAAKARTGLSPRGSADLWDVQAALKERGYYNTGLLDGLDGSKTQAAVAQIRKDNGLGDGGIDAEFMAGLPNWPHARISTDRATISLASAEQHAPELFSPPKWLTAAGTGLLGLGGASGAGLMDQVQGGVAKANDVFGQVQTVFGLVAGVVGFVVEHKTWFFVGLGLFLLWKGVSAILTAWIKVRQAFF
jgi:lysozyme